MIKVKKDGANLVCDQITALLLLELLDAGTFHVKNRTAKFFLEGLKKNLEEAYKSEVAE